MAVAQNIVVGKDLTNKERYEEGYRLIGNHSAVKVCEYCRKSIKGVDVCYKNTFYGINSWRCVQMSPTFFCDHRCVFCWRNTDYAWPKWQGPVDGPKLIVDECIKQQKTYLQGFQGNKKANMNKFNEAMDPNQFAISLSGEPTFYPYLDELIKEIKKIGTAFLVTNGTNPKTLEKLIKNNAMPTQMYLTLPAPNEEIYNKICNPIKKDNWKNILKSLKLLNQFKRSTIRLTLVKNLNMINPEQYAELIKTAKPDFVEAKAFVCVGYSKYRLNIEDMPRHNEIKNFAERLSKLINYKIKDEKKESRVVLLSNLNNPSIHSRVYN